MSKKFTCVDLFSGAGGLSRGFYDAGYDVVLGVDITGHIEGNEVRFI